MALLSRIMTYCGILIVFLAILGNKIMLTILGLAVSIAGVVLGMTHEMFRADEHKDEQPEKLLPPKGMLQEGHVLGQSGSVVFSPAVTGSWQKLGPGKVGWKFFLDGKPLSIVGASSSTIFQMISPNHIASPSPHHSSWIGWDREVTINEDGSIVLEISKIEPTNVYDKRIISESAAITPGNMQIRWLGFKQTIITQDPHVD